jgi:hypothetical protein
LMLQSDVIKGEGDKQKITSKATPNSALHSVSSRATAMRGCRQATSHCAGVRPLEGSAK